MTANQMLIAETAIGRRQAPTFDQIQDEVSQMTGMSLSEVKATVSCLIAEEVLKVCVTPARNMLEGPRPPDEVVWAWYEKGRLWPQQAAAT
jgi:hypothetical protein